MHVLTIVNINVHITPASVNIYIVVVDRVVATVIIDRSVATIIGVAPVGASSVVCRLRCGRLFGRGSTGLSRLTSWLFSLRVPFLILG